MSFRDLQSVKPSIETKDFHSIWWLESLTVFLLQMTEAQPGKLKASEFHLSWNNYEASLASFLRVLSEAKEGEEALYDVTISCSGGKLFQVLLDW